MLKIDSAMIDGLQIALKGNVGTGDRQESRENIEIGQSLCKEVNADTLR